MHTDELRAHLISAKELSLGWLSLYALSFALQGLCAAVRAAIAYPAIWLLFTLFGEPTTNVHTLSLLVGYGPLAVSLATLILPLGGWWWQQHEGARALSERERLIYEDALAVLRGVDPNLRGPKRVCVLDDGEINASAYADTLMLTRGLLESRHLEAVLAHELGHLNSSDSRLTAAVFRLTTPPRTSMRFPFKVLSLVASGAAGWWVVRLAWAAYWRSREYQADLYAAHLGQGQALIEFLEADVLLSDLPMPFVWLSEKSHPPTEFRIERLMGAVASGAGRGDPAQPAAPSALPAVRPHPAPPSGLPVTHVREAPQGGVR